MILFWGCGEGLVFERGAGWGGVGIWEGSGLHQ